MELYWTKSNPLICWDITKRFEFVSVQTGSIKKQDRIEFPCGLETLDLQSFLAPGTTVTSSKYCLNAVVQHHGQSRQSGHYTAVARHHPTSKWYRFNDDSIPVPLSTDNVYSDVVNDRAYVLFYQKLSSK